MSLHLIFSAAGWQAAQDRIATDDAVVMLGDGVYVRTMSKASRPPFVMGEDARARGLAVPQEPYSIDYDQLVELCTEHFPVVSWHD